ncbi:histidine kinase [Halorubellus sp. JP-L1]|uniref:histidine kinase n=1 Tax=Halorubellus sp. JP-L1 TaxID=2715753 RepID=UPI0014077748|nr:histidine kinase [Halorubellus sp. JP-L1]NHN43339.1 histidine kinase [Halorubellus sp. JP-L1]
MSETATQTETGTDARLAEWQAGVIGGVLGGVVMAVLYSAFQPSFLTDAVPGIYGLDGAGGIVGWTLHVSHAAVLGVVFAFAFDAVEGAEWRLPNTTAVSVVLALTVWAFAALLVDQVGIWNTGVAPAPASFDVTLLGFVTHLAYGLVVGVTAALLR